MFPRTAQGSKMSSKTRTRLKLGKSRVPVFRFPNSVSSEACPPSPSSSPRPARAAGLRDKNYKKPFAPLGGRAVWLHSAERFMNRADVKQMIVVDRGRGSRSSSTCKFGANIAILGVQVVEGGEHRADSVQRALERVKSEIEFVAVHDAARPCIADEWIDAGVRGGRADGAAILAAPVAETLKRVDGKKQITETVDRAVAVGGADAASLSPRAAHRGVRQARQRCRSPTMPSSSSGWATR